MTGADLAREVTPAEPLILEGNGPRVIAIDTGIKTSIVRNLRERGVHLELHPCTVTSKQLLARNPDAVFLANGPGDPAALDYIVDAVRGVVGKTPVWGICLGHQLLCRAVGLETYKLAFGHRGANHPVKDLETGRIEITSQNHGFAVDPQTLPADVAVTHMNLYDGTVEGLRHLHKPVFSVQYHPEASPGPHDADYLFREFVDAMEKT
jgi:carbamoyl-phosphate synthase small subunit